MNDTISTALLVLILVVLVFIAIIPLFFVTIPRNHIVCVEIQGSFKHLLCHSQDLQKIKLVFEKLPDRFKYKPDPGDPTGKKLTTNYRPEFTEMLNHLSLIRTRDNHLFYGIMVGLFNLHFKSWIPWSTLREVKVVKTRINPAFNNAIQTNLKDMVKYDSDEDGSVDVTTKYLRIQFPRVGMSDLELMNNVKIRIIWSVSSITIFDPWSVFYHNQEISSTIDFQINQGWVNFLGRMDFPSFQKEPLTANPDNRLNKFFKDANPPDNDDGNAGLIIYGFYITGAISEDAFDLSEESKRLAEATENEAISKTKFAIAQNEANADAARVKTGADAEAYRTTTIAEAKAKAIRLEGAATGDAVGKLKIAIAGDPHVADVLGKEALGKSSISTLVLGDNTPTIINPKP